MSNEVRNVLFELVEIGQAVFTDGDQHVHGQVRLVEESRQLSPKRAVARLTVVIDEVFLELVEYEQAVTLGVIARYMNRLIQRVYR